MATITIPKISRKKINLNRYAGKWVAFFGDQVIAHNDNLRALMREVETKGLRKKVNIFLVPRKDEGPYILVLL